MSNGHPNVATRIEALTSLRFFAAFVVVSFHFGLDSSLVSALPGIFTAGSEMVTLFFVLSGFVLTLAYAEKAQFATREYFVNRLARIAPAYYLALALVVLITVSHGLKDLHPRALLLSATFLQSWFPGHARILNIPAWSLSVEIAFYLIFPFVLRYALRMPTGKLLLGTMILWALTQVLTIRLLNSPWYQGAYSATSDLLFLFPPMHLGSFLLGICGACLLIERNRERVKPVSEFWSGWKTVGICALTLLVLQGRDAIQQASTISLPFAGSLLSPLFLLLILQLAFGHDRFSRALSWGPFLLLGQASYSFYILQMPVHWIFLKTASPLLRTNADMQFWAFVTMLAVLSILSHKCIELPAARLIRRLMRKKPVSLPASTAPAAATN